MHSIPSQVASRWRLNSQRQDPYLNFSMNNLSIGGLRFIEMGQASSALWYNAPMYNRIFDIAGLPISTLSDVCVIANSDIEVLALEDAMNWSLYTADRTTHLKIIVVGLSTALLMSVMGIAATEYNRGTDVLAAQAITVIKAGAPVAFTNRDGLVVR